MRQTPRPEVRGRGLREGSAVSREARRGGRGRRAAGLTWRRCGRIRSAKRDLWRDDGRVPCGHLWWPFFRGSRACSHDDGWRVEKSFSFSYIDIFIYSWVPCCGSAGGPYGSATGRKAGAHKRSPCGERVHFGLQNYTTFFNPANFRAKKLNLTLLGPRKRPFPAPCRRIFFSS